MMPATLTFRRILAIEPTIKGFGFVVLEEPDRLVDWGLKEVSGEKNTACLRQIESLILRYKPDLVAFPDVSHKARRSDRVRNLVLRAHELIRKHGVTQFAASRSDVKKLFDPLSAKTKDMIASRVAARFKELADWVPPPRKAWSTADARLAIFMALTFAMAADSRLGAEHSLSQTKF